MRKNLFIRNFETMQIKAPIKTRFFIVLIISFFSQIHLIGAVTKNDHGDRSALILRNDALPNSASEYLEHINNSDSANRAANIKAPVPIKDFQEKATKSISSSTFSDEYVNDQNEDNTIFVTAGTTVFSLNDRNHIKIISVTEKYLPQKVTKSLFLEDTNLALSEKKAKIKLAQLAKEIHEKPDHNFSTSPAGNSGVMEILGKVQTAVILSPNILQKDALVPIYYRAVLKIDGQLKEQRFYSSVCCLQFRKYNFFSLRGPPIYS